MRWIVGIVLVAVVGQGVAEAGERDTARRRFWYSLTATGAGLTGYVLSVQHVHALEDEKQQQFELWTEHADPGTFDDYPRNDAGAFTNVCDMADDFAGSSEHAAHVASTCASGRRWATTANWLLVGTAVTTGLTGYYAYQAFKGDDADTTDGLQVTPVVTPQSIGASLSLGF